MICSSPSSPLSFHNGQPDKDWVCFGQLEILMTTMDLYLKCFVSPRSVIAFKLKYNCSFMNVALCAKTKKML